MSRIPEHIIDQILQTARIEEVIGEFVQLKRSGSNLKGLSPFTDERTASFMVSPAKQIFKCFSSGKGGTAVSFLMEKEHFTYPEALRWLAQKYNIDIPKQEELTAEELALVNERDSLYIINEFAKNHFSQNLWQTDEGKSIGLSYFEERGFKKETVEKFQLGYCLNTGTDLTTAALDKGFKFEYLEKVGLSKAAESRRFDFFRGRVMFPIHSISGRVLGFGGRVLHSDKKVAKYFNSPESPVYNKSEILYGLFFGKNEIIKRDACFLCEGYTDVISLHQAGIENVVSSSGTALTKDQIKLIARYTKNIVILFDGDTAGIKASFRGIDLILEEGLNVKIVLFPEGEDPDSYAKSRDKQEIVSFLTESAQDFISFKAGVLLKEVSNDPIQTATAIKDIVASIALVPDPIARSVYTQSIAQRYGLEEALIQQEVLRIRSGKMANEYQEPSLNVDFHAKPKRNLPTETKEERFTEEREVIRLMLKYGNHQLVIPNEENSSSHTSAIELMVHELTEDDIQFHHPVCAKIYSQILDGISEGILYSYKYFLRAEDKGILDFVGDIMGFEDELSSRWESVYRIRTKHESSDLYQTVMQAIFHLKFVRVSQHIKTLQARLTEETTTEEEVIMLLAEQVAYEKVKKSFSERLGRIIY